jgi:hypothetical protein
MLDLKKPKAAPAAPEENDELEKEDELEVEAEDSQVSAAKKKKKKKKSKAKGIFHIFFCISKWHFSINSIIGKCGGFFIGGFP